MKTLTGYKKILLYIRIALHVAIYYSFRMVPWNYIIFLKRAYILLMAFSDNKVVCTDTGYKLQLYLPEYPGKAFFRTIETKLISRPAGPATVVYSMTKRCDYKCPHCYQRNDSGADLVENELIDTALAIKQAGVTMFDIEGGEALLDVKRLVALVTALGDGVECWVNTHGRLLDSETAKVLKHAGVYGFMISIHSPKPSEHDKFTKVDGSFDAACRAAAVAKENGFVVAFNSVLQADQLIAGELDQLMELARKCNCDFVQLIHPKPAGKWLSCHKEIEQSEKVVKYVMDKHIEYNSSNFNGYPSLAAQVFEERSLGLGCTAGGVDRFYVNAAGEVQPCEFLNISFGNIKEEKFGVIFNRMRNYFAEPCEQWLCCRQAEAIQRALIDSGQNETPLKWQYTQKLVASWDRGRKTRLYKKLGIYKSS